jgi:hypothetical protein
LQQPIYQNRAGSALSGAVGLVTLGAGIGSAFPGIGTGLGAAFGGGLGPLGGLF